MKINLRKILSVCLLFLFAFVLLACEQQENKVNYTVNFDTHGGTNVPSQTVEKGKFASVPSPEPTYADHTFAGWYLNLDDTEQFKFATTPIESNITIHAKWAPVAITTFTIVFNVNGGDPINPVTRNQGQQIGQLPTPTRAGYTFNGWFLDQGTTQSVISSALVTSNMTVYAKWTEVVVKYTVTFNPGLGEVLPETLEVAHHGKISQPAADYLGHELAGWFKDEAFTMPWNFAVDVVTSNMTLYAKWDLIPEGTAITSQDDFYNLVLGLTTYESGSKFYLKNDLDFTGFNWDGSLFTEDPTRIHNFNLNGNGKTIKNISYQTPAQAGLIQRMSGGSVTNLTLENIEINGGTQGGILIGRVVSGSTVSITDVTLRNIKVEGHAAGVGALIGHIQGSAGLSTVTLERIAILGASVKNNNASTAGLVGDLESSKLVIKDVLVDAVVHSTGERVGGLLGEARRNSSVDTLPELVVDGAVIYVNLTGNRYLGTIVGRADNNLLNIKVGEETIAKQLPGSIANVVMMANYQVLDETNSSNGHIARFNAPDSTNAYMIAFNYNKATLNSSTASSVTYQPNNVDEDKLLSDLSKFEASMASGFNTELWTVQNGKLPMLKGMEIEGFNEVTIQKSEEVSQVQYVRDGASISPIYFEPQLGVIVGWFSDIELTTEVTEVNDAMTVYPKLLQRFTVAFDAKGGSAVASQQVLDGSKATLPTAPTRDYLSFGGWYVDESFLTQFDFETSIKENTTLYAKWVDDVKPVAEFLTEAGSHSVALNQPFEIQVKILDASVVSIVLKVGTGASFELVNQAPNPDHPYYPFASEAQMNAAMAIGLQAGFMPLTDTLTIMGTSQLINSTWKDNFEVELVLTDAPLNESVTIKETFKVEVVTVYHTVTFETDGGTTIEDVEVLEGTELTMPTNPIKAGFVFVGWFKDAGLTTPFMPNEAIMTDMTLYAKYEEFSYVPEGTAITTAQEFYNLATGVVSLSEKYYLANDIDFTGFTWTWVSSKSFTGQLDGNFKSIKNLTIVSNEARAGIWYSINGATIKNITFDNVSISSTAGTRAGIIAAEAVNNKVTLTNIVVKNSSVIGNASNGVGSLVGYLHNHADVSNITVLDTNLKNGTQATGGLFGRLGDSSASWVINVSDVYMNNVKVEGTARVGGLFGETNGNVVITLNRALLSNMIITGSGTHVAGISGRHQPVNTQTSNMADVYVNADITGTTNVNHITTDKLYQSTVNTNFFGTITGTQGGTAALSVLTEAPTEVWFTQTFESMVASPLWVYSATQGTFVLVNSQS